MDWIVCGSANPGKVLFLYLSNSSLQVRSSNSEKASLTLYLQELCNNILSSENNQTLVSSKYLSARSYTELSRITYAAFVFMSLVLGSDTAFVL